MDNTTCVNPDDCESWPCTRWWCGWWDDPVLAADYGVLCEDFEYPCYPDYIGADSCRARFGVCRVSE